VTFARANIARGLIEQGSFTIEGTVIRCYEYKPTSEWFVKENKKTELMLESLEKGAGKFIKLDMSRGVFFFSEIFHFIFGHCEFLGSLVGLIFFSERETW
jgi:hypothetical protein